MVKLQLKPKPSQPKVFTWVNRALRANMKRRAKDLYFYKNEAIAHQNELLKNLIQFGTLVEYGNLYGFDMIQNAEEFSTQVPLSNYPVLEPYIERMRNGEMDVLWPGKVSWFAKSSGTTSGISKYIPISKENLEDCHFQGGKSELALYCNYRPDTKMFEGLGLRLGGSLQAHQTNRSQDGDLSAIIMDNMPIWSKMVSAPSQEVALMSNWEEKLEAMVNEVVDQNITSFWGVSSWFLVFAQAVLEKTGKEHLLEVWPNLELFAHGGVNFAPYQAQFRALFPGDQVVFLENYNASEGFFAVQDRPESEGMLLLLDNGIYYEFIPMSQFDGLDSTTIALEEVELDTEYALVITTNSGLWRYLVGDTIKFTSTDPYRIQVTGRTAHFINAFGEEVIVSDAESALHEACQQHPCSIVDFHAAPSYMEGRKSGAHQWIIDFSQPPSNLDLFAHTLDDALRKENSDYDAKRKGNLLLGPPQIVVAKQGLFHAWLKQRNKLGGQNKIPRLSNSRALIEEFLALNEQLQNGQ